MLNGIELMKQPGISDKIGSEMAEDNYRYTSNDFQIPSHPK